MNIDLDIVAIGTGFISAISSFISMRVTVKYLEKSVDEIKRDFKGIGAKLGRQSDEITYLKGKIDGTSSREHW